MTTTNQANDTPKRRTWPWIVGIVAAWLIGMAIGAAGGGDTTPAAQPAAEPEVETIEIEVDSPELLDRLAELEEQLAAAEEAAEEQAEVEEVAETEGDYTAGSYVLNDVQVSEDGIGDFQVRARVTNTGGAQSIVGLKATIFDGSTVVGTADAILSDVGAGETVTAEFLSVDGYTSWDSVEFQVDAEW